MRAFLPPDCILFLGFHALPGSSVSDLIRLIIPPQSAVCAENHCDLISAGSYRASQTQMILSDPALRI